MGLTITKIRRVNAGSCKVGVFDVDFDSSYPAGGESLTAANLGFNTVDLVICAPKSGFSFDYDYTNSKLKVLCPGVVTTAAGAGTLDDFPLSGLGATTASVGLTAGNATTRFGAQVEIADTVDLSTLTDVRIIVFGNAAGNE